MKMDLTIGSLADLTHFPFDVQVLQLNFKMQKMKFMTPLVYDDDDDDEDDDDDQYNNHRAAAAAAAADGGGERRLKGGMSKDQVAAMLLQAMSKKTALILADPVTWRPTEGHQMAPSVDWFAEYDPVWIDGSNLRDFNADTDKLDQCVVFNRFVFYLLMAGWLATWPGVAWRVHRSLGALGFSRVVCDAHSIVFAFVVCP